jgi:squalene-associated FAD-dependent desaturase
VKIAVVGGGWAGLAAAVRATEAGHAATLFEMAGQLGGRARTVAADDQVLDSGQHILIGAYSRCLALMRTVGCDVDAVLDRRPLELRYPDGRGLRMPAGPAWLAFGRAAFGCQGWGTRDRLALMLTSARWALGGFRCASTQSVADLCGGLTQPVRTLLIDPLCVAALNTPAHQASGQVFLRVLADAIFGGAGSADLLLPRRALGELLPGPAQSWLTQHGARLALGHRVLELRSAASGWSVDGDSFDRVILACSVAEATRLAQTLAPAWAGLTGGLRYQPIVTVYFQCDGAALPAPMTALVEGPLAPAQFAFDHGAIGSIPGRFAFVISGAGRWLDQGQAALSSAVQAQAEQVLRPPSRLPGLKLVRVMTDKRATFSCTPGLQRPSPEVAQGLLAAGDYVRGPYPATLEGAVRSGEEAIRLALASS